LDRKGKVEHVAVTGWQMEEKAAQTSEIDSGDKHDPADQHRIGF
jgi:hypothetical protein